MINQDPHHPWTAPDRPKFFDHDPPASALYSSAGRDKRKKKIKIKKKFKNSIQESKTTLLFFAITLSDCVISR